MLKKTIAYKDLDEKDQVEDFYFNLSIDELTDMASSDNALVTKLEAMGSTEDGAEILKIFKDLISMSIGERSADRKKFDKKPEYTAYFIGSEPYNAMFLEFMRDPQSAAAFINSLVPAEVLKMLAEQQAADEAAKDKPVTDVQLPEAVEQKPAYILENREPTPYEMRMMSQEQLVEAMMRKNAPRPATDTEAARTDEI